MTTIPTTQANPMLTDIACADANNVIGNSAREDLKGTMDKIEASFLAAFQDSEVFIVGGGDLFFDGTNLTWSDTIVFYYKASTSNSTEAALYGAVAAGSIAIGTNNMVLTYTINRTTSGALTLDNSETTANLDTIKSSNINKRVFAVRYNDVLYLCNGQSLQIGQIVTLGASGGGSSGGGELNYIKYPNEVGAGTYSWKESTNEQVDVSKTTTSSELPRAFTTPSALKIVGTGTSSTDYVYTRFTSDYNDLQATLKLQWDQKIISSIGTTFSVDVWHTTDSTYATGLSQIATFSIPDTTTRFVQEFNVQSKSYLELRIKKTTSAQGGSFSICNVTISPGTKLLKKNLPLQTADYNTYISNSLFEEGNITGWGHYNDGGSTPTTGATGFGGSGYLQGGASNDSIVRNRYSFLLRKLTNEDSQGEGFSYSFTIAPVDQAKVLNISFEYIKEGAFAVSSSNLIPSDITVWIYDITNAVLIQPSCIVIDGSGRYSSYFQTASNSTSYRLIFHSANVGSSEAAWQLYIDSIIIGKTPSVSGVPASDWTAWTPVIGGVSTSSTSGHYRRVAGDLEIEGVATCNGTASATVTVTIPSSLSLDISLVEDQYGVLGHGSIVDSNDSNKTYMFEVVVNNDATTTLAFALRQPGLGLMSNTSTPTPATGDTIRFRASLPILGWSSNVAMSSDTDNREHMLNAELSVGLSLTAGNNTAVIYNTVTKDTTPGAYNSTTGIFTAPEAGSYTISINGTFVTGATAPAYLNYWILVNSTNVSSCYRDDVIASKNYPASASITYYLNAGDTVSVFARSQTQNATLKGRDTGFATSLNIIHHPGRATIAASEKVAMEISATTTTNPTGTLNSSNNVIVYPTPSRDTHGGYSAGVYTCPIAGWYNISAGYAIAGTESSGYYYAISIAKNGATVLCRAIKYLDLNTDLAIHQINISGSFYFMAGETIQIWSRTTITSPSFNNNASECYFTISRDS